MLSISFLNLKCMVWDDGFKEGQRLDGIDQMAWSEVNEILLD